MRWISWIIILSASSWGATYTPNYNDLGVLASVQISNLTVPLDAGNKECQAWLTWMQANDATYQTWTAANPGSTPTQLLAEAITCITTEQPWHPWGSMVLSAYQAQVIASFKQQFEAYIQTYYTQLDLQALEHLLGVARANGNTSAVTSIEAVFTWWGQAYALYNAGCNSVKACALPQQVANVGLVFTSLTPPTLTVQQAITAVGSW
jgi:hypothetical protein